MNAEDYAILIGIGRYPELDQGGQPLDLAGPVNDVEAIKAWLLDPKGGGFPDEKNIRVITSVAAASAAEARPTADELDAALGALDRIAQRNREAGKGLRVGRRIYLFMSGHGFSPARQRGCLFSANATDRQGFNVHATGWLSWLQDSGYFREFVLWMDCCMNRMSFLQPRDPMMPLVNAMEPPRASFVAFAAQRPLKAVEVPIEEDGGRTHGLFTWTLIEGLRGAAADANGRVTGRSLADWIRNAQAARISPKDFDDPEVAKEPDVIQEDGGLIFARGAAKPLYEVRVSFPPGAQGAVARLWCGSPPRVAKQFPVTGAPEILALHPGLYLIDVEQASLRHGFEVVRPAEVTIDGQGPAVIDAPPGTVFQLEVDAGDPTAEIFVVDTQFSLADGNPARLSTALPFGLFKIKTRIGRAIMQHVILLDRDRPQLETAAIAQPAATVIPILGTAASHEYQAAGRATALGAVRALGQTGSRAAIMVMARAFSGRDARANWARPWDGVSVVDAQGQTVLDLQSEGEVHASGDPYATCTKPVEPGYYFLRQRLDDGTTVEQSIVVCDGWGHEVYVLRRGDPGETALRPRPRVSVMMRRLGQPVSADFEDRLIETARVALADERRILNAELEPLLLQKFENPMAGIIGGHLLLVERERDHGRDVSLLDTVVKRLHALVGTGHPDVAALALHCADAKLRRAVKALAGPPMLQRSWMLLAEAAQKRPSLISAVIWERVQALTALPPFLVWAVDDAVKSGARRDLVRAILGEPTGAQESAVLSAVRDLGPPGGARSAAARAAPAPPGTLARTAKARAAQMGLPPSALEALKAQIR